MTDLSFPLAGGVAAGELVFSGAWASAPSASAYLGKQAFFSDIGPNGSYFIATTGGWTPLNGVALIARSAVQASVTGTVNETTLATITIPAGIMGLNGVLRLTTQWSCTNNANAKTIRVRFSGAAGTNLLGLNVANTASSRYVTQMANRNSASSQIAGAANGAVTGATSGGTVSTAVDTSAATSLVVSGQLGSTGDTLTLESYTLELLR